MNKLYVSLSVMILLVSSMVYSVEDIFVVWNDSCHRTNSATLDKGWIEVEPTSTMSITDALVTGGACNFFNNAPTPPNIDSMSRTFTADTPTNFSFKLRGTLAGGDTEVYFRIELYSDDLLAVSFYQRTSDFYDGAGNIIFSPIPTGGPITKVNVILDYGADTYDFYIDDVLKTADIAFNNSVSSINNISISNRDTTSGGNSGPFYDFNLTRGGIVPATTATPTIESPSPIDNSKNNTNVTLNVSHSTTQNDVRYYLYFGTSSTLTEIDLFLNNVTRTGDEYSNFTTNVSDGVYFWKWRVQNITNGKFSANTTQRTLTIDTP